MELTELSVGTLKAVRELHVIACRRKNKQQLRVHHDAISNINSAIEIKELGPRPVTTNAQHLAIVEMERANGWSTE